MRKQAKTGKVDCLEDVGIESEHHNRDNVLDAT